MVEITRPRGTRDIGPEDMRYRREIERRMRSVCEVFGYEEVLTPTFEHADLFRIKSGDEVLEEMYVFRDKGGRELALRPEITASVMRYYREEMKRRAKPIKLYYFENCFRYERPQSGRYREFWQLGVELIGTSRAEAVAEVISLAMECLRSIPLQNVLLRVGHIGMLRNALSLLGVGEKEQSEILRMIDKGDIESALDKISSLCCATNKIKQFSEMLECDDLSALRMHAENIGLSMQELNKLEVVASLLKSMGVDWKLDMSIARGLDYYSGVVFEIDSPILGAEKQICGGGEYNLAAISGEDVPTVGFALGFDRIVLAAKKEGVSIDGRKTTTYIIPLSDEYIGICMGMAMNIRRAGIVCHVDLMGRGLRKALSHASTIGVDYCIIIGKREVDRGEVVLRDMRSGVQKNVPFSEITQRLMIQSE